MHWTTQTVQMALYGLLGAAAVVLGVIVWLICMVIRYFNGERGERARTVGQWSLRVAPVAVPLMSVLIILVLTACGDTINPVRYEVQPVLVVKPCFAGRTPPTEARTLVQVSCDEKGACGDARCTDTHPETCAAHAIADLYELQREARQYRNLFKECSK